MMNTTTRRFIFPAIAAIAVTLVVNGIPATSIAYAQSKPPAPTLTLVTKPSPPKAGQTTFTVTLKGPDGKPVTGADVTVELVMPAMPSMNMAEMRNKVTLKPATDAKLAAAGTYTGTGQILMAATWNVLVTAKVNGKDYAETKLTLTAK
jgi:hypothetical protein